MKEVYGEIYFTEYDEKITGTSRRDPLGLQPIWSYYGRRVIKHLTTVSTDIRGFREVLLCLAICGEYKNRHQEESYKDLILLFEQLFVYAAIRHDSTEGILGADNGISRYKASNKNPMISSTDTILIREISLGYYGRYKTPLSTMGIINKNSNVADEIDVVSLYGSTLYKKIYNAFATFVSLRPEDRVFMNFGARKEIFEAVCGKFRKEEKEFWIRKLQIEGFDKNELMSACYSIVEADKSYRNVFDELTYSLPVKDIEKLEPFLRCMESVFYLALSSKTVDEVHIEKRVLEDHKERFKDFVTITDAKEANSVMLDRRLNYIKKKCSPESDSYVNSIISYHKMVCEQKNSAVWLEVDAGGNIQSFVQPDTKIDIEEWGRDYYLSSLLSIKLGIKELSE